MGQLALQSAFEILGRRSFMRRAACAGLCAAAPALNLLAGPANAASNWRGLVGCVKPTVDNSSLVDMIRLLPRGIGVVPVYLNFSEGTREEIQSTYANYEKSVTYLASLRCDTISIEGAPPTCRLRSWSTVRPTPQAPGSFDFTMIPSGCWASPRNAGPGNLTQID